MKNSKRFIQSGINQQFPTQKVIADMQLKETLRSISAYHSYDDESLPSYLVSDKPMVHIMKSVLKASDMPENLFDKTVLEKRYQDFSRRLDKTEEMMFTLPQLFEEGWLIDCGDEWMHNCSPKRYKGLSFADNHREEQIVKFLAELSDIGVYDMELTFDPVKNAKLLTSLNVSVDELLKVGILYVDEVINDAVIASTEAEVDSDETLPDDVGDEHRNTPLYISSHTDIWRSLGSIVLSSILDEWLDEGTDDNCYGIWLNYCRYLKHVYTPERYVSDKKTLYDYCLRIIKNLHSNVNMESQKLTKALLLSSNNKGHTVDIPSNPRLREEYFGQRVDYYHEVKFISYFPYTIAGLALDMCCRLYSHVPMDVRKGLPIVLADAYFSIPNHYNCNLANPDLAVDAIKRENLCYLSLVTIYGELQRRATDRTSGIYAVEKFADELWDVMDKFGN